MVTLRSAYMSLSKAGTIWEYFDKPEKFSDFEADINVKVKCKVCGDVVSCSKKATSYLVTHLQVCYSGIQATSQES